jgi:hypothetical protein
MKQEEINIRISPTLKKDFQDICEVEETTMSNKINNFIVKEVNDKKPKDSETNFSEFLSIMGFNNITIIKSPSAVINTANEPKRYLTMTYRCDFIEFVKIHKDRRIYLYLLGSDVLNNEFRLFLV